jgi:branched-chain amino acid transport system substrate-binding protein
VSKKNRPEAASSRPRISTITRLGAAAAMVAAVAACSSSSKSGTTGSSSASPITIGLLTTLSGLGTSNFFGNLQGAQARIDLENAHGGVNGHKINLVSADDQTSFTGATNAMSQLIDVRHAFAILNLSDFTVSAYRLAQRAGIPVVGFPADGPEWGQQPNTNMVSIIGNVPPVGVGGEVNTVTPNVAKLLGATNMAALAIDAEQASIQGAQSFIKASQSIGLKVGYQNFSIPIGSTNVTPVVLGMKNAHVDGFNSGLLNNTNYALLSSARTEGLALKAPILAAGYGQDVLDQPATEQAAQGAIFQVFQRPVDQPNAESRTEQSAFATYEHFTGVPSIGWTSGWISADLLIQGLSKAGSSPTRTSLLNALHNLKGYDAEGLMPVSVDLSLSGFGKAPARQCYWYTQLNGSKFVTINGGKPVCGNNVS